MTNVTWERKGFDGVYSSYHKKKTKTQEKESWFPLKYTHCYHGYCKCIWYSLPIPHQANYTVFLKVPLDTVKWCSIENPVCFHYNTSLFMYFSLCSSLTIL